MNAASYNAWAKDHPTRARWVTCYALAAIRTSFPEDAAPADPCEYALAKSAALVAMADLGVVISMVPA